MTNDQARRWLQIIKRANVVFTDRADVSENIIERIIDAEQEALDIAINELASEEHDGCDGCHYEHYGEEEQPCVECCQNYTEEYTPKKDLVEVVRCADCKYKYPKDMDMFCRFFVGGPLMASGYCSKGERK